MIDGKQTKHTSQFALRYKFALLVFALIFGVLAFRAIEHIGIRTPPRDSPAR